MLIANRGEIALRIIRACHEEGLEAVAVYSDADRLSPHVRAADLAVPIGPPSPAESYLRIDRLLEAAAGHRRAVPSIRATASSPSGPRFAQAVADAGLVFVGPPAERHHGHGRQDRGAPPDAAPPACPIVPGLTLPVTDPAAADRRGRGDRLPGAGEGRGRRRREGHARGARRSEISPAR